MSPWLPIRAWNVRRRNMAIWVLLEFHVRDSVALGVMQHHNLIRAAVLIPSFPPDVQSQAKIFGCVRIRHPIEARQAKSLLPYHTWYLPAQENLCGGRGAWAQVTDSLSRSDVAQRPALSADTKVQARSPREPRGKHRTKECPWIWSNKVEGLANGRASKAFQRS